MLTILAHLKKTFVVLLLFVVATPCFGQIASTQFKQEVQIDSVLMYRDLAFQAAKDNNPAEAVAQIEKYVARTLDLSFIEHSSFSFISRSPEYIGLQEKYLPKFRWASIFYMYAGLIGFFIIFMFAIRRKKDMLASILLSLFLFIHSVFIIHVGLYTMNYTYYMPHTQAMSTVFSFLYGPLLYFYFKRIKTGYTFHWKDLMHLIPTLYLLVLFIPIYSLSESDKLRMMLGVGPYEQNPYGEQVAIGKMIILIVYAFLTLRLWQKTRENRTTIKTPLYLWQRNVVLFQGMYALIYCIYAILLLRDVRAGFVFNTQLILMSAMVLYVAYVAYANPKVLMGFHLERSFLKYKNSGLTSSYSVELKQQLLSLLEEQKIYRENNINLDTLAERLGTTRHSTSQIINEHFGMNFFELINNYRIQEAMNILKSDTAREKNIIDVAYEVGFNNKVTFNKSFKKINDVTPSQYLKALYA
ncbi:MAG: helix-turn-helix domain-containing protein [Gilvibacter sp.]